MSFLRLGIIGLLLLALSACSVEHPSPSSSLPDHWDTHGKNTFVFDPASHEWAAYDVNGDRVEHGRASGGADYCPELNRPCRTVVGTFHVYAMKGADCKSSKFPLSTGGGALMPYCMYFNKKGYAIHGSPGISNIHSSHGCIRVQTDKAKWLYEHFIHVGTPVIVLPYPKT